MKIHSTNVCDVLLTVYCCFQWYITLSLKNKGSVLELVVPWRIFNINGTFLLYKTFFKCSLHSFLWI